MDNHRKGGLHLVSGNVVPFPRRDDDLLEYQDDRLSMLLFNGVFALAILGPLCVWGYFIARCFL